MKLYGCPCEVEWGFLILLEPIALFPPFLSVLSSYVQLNWTDIWPPEAQTKNQGMSLFPQTVFCFIQPSVKWNPHNGVNFLLLDLGWILLPKHCSDVLEMTGCHLDLSFERFWASARKQWKTEMCSCVPALQKSFTAGWQKNWLGCFLVSSWALIFPNCASTHNTKHKTLLCGPKTGVWEVFSAVTLGKMSTVRILFL